MKGIEGETCEYTSAADNRSGAVVVVGPGSGAVVVVGPGSGAVVVVGPGSGAVVVVGPGSGAVVVVGPGSGAVVVVGPGSGAVVVVGPGSGAVVVVGSGAEVCVATVVEVFAGVGVASVPEPMPHACRATAMSTPAPPRIHQEGERGRIRQPVARIAATFIRPSVLTWLRGEQYINLMNRTNGFFGNEGGVKCPWVQCQTDQTCPVYYIRRGRRLWGTVRNFV